MNPILLTRSEVDPVLRMDLVPGVATAARELFTSSAQDFQRGVDNIVDFDPSYQLQEDECFRIRDFQIEDAILTACQQPISVDRLQPNMIADLSIKSIAGYNFTGSQRQIYFQNFDSRRVLIPGRRFAVFSIADAATYQELQQPVILLDAKLAAIWDNGVLTFKSFHSAKQIFDLSAYFKAATDEQIVQFAAHPRFICGNQQVLLNTCTQWHRKKIALILRSGILDNIEAESISAAAGSVGYVVTMEGDRLRLPSENNELRELLQFLDEDIYRGPISQRKLISSGKRMAQ